MTYDKGIGHTTAIHEGRERRNCGVADPSASKLSMEVSNDVPARHDTTFDAGSTGDLLSGAISCAGDIGSCAISDNDSTGDSGGYGNVPCFRSTRFDDAADGWRSGGEGERLGSAIAFEQSNRMGQHEREAQSGTDRLGDQRCTVKGAGLSRVEDMVECVLSEMAIELPKRDFRGDLMSALTSSPFWRGNDEQVYEAGDVVDHILVMLTLQGWCFGELLSGTVLAFQRSDAADLARGAVGAVLEIGSLDDL